MQHPRPVGPTGVNAAATFGQEMIAGSRPPERSRFYTPVHRQGLGLSQTTHVAATFQPNMSQGWQPPEQRYSAPLHAGWLGQSADVQLFSVEMVVGSRPDRSRVLLGPQIGQPLSQTTHVAAAFSAEMADGSIPDRSRAYVPPKLGGTWWTPEVDPFGIEMVIGSHPDQPRVMLGPRIALPVSQPTHTAATFTIDMVTGHQPSAKRYVAPFHQGAQLWTTEVNAFSVEMSVGSIPDRAPRLPLGAKIPLPVSQPTHTAAAFTVDMIAGSQPPTKRYSAPFHQGVTWLTTEIDGFTVDMVVGSHPDRPRIVLGPKIPLPVSQPTHTAATFSLEMSQGAAPAEQSRAYVAKKVGWSVSQTTQTDARFSTEMVQGVTWQPWHWRKPTSHTVIVLDAPADITVATPDLIVTAQSFVTTVTVKGFVTTVIVPQIQTGTEP